jgi:protocatechuate 3,4-dioxygenase beta subunit
VSEEDNSTDPVTGEGAEPMPPVDGNGMTNCEVPVYQEVTTDENGYYEFPDPFNGMGVYVNVNQDSYMPNSCYFAREADGEVEANLTMTPIVPVSISGTVKNEAGDAIEGAYVEFIYIDPNFYGRGYAVPGGGGLENMDAGGMAWASTGATDAALPGAAPPPESGGYDESLDSYGMAKFRQQNRENRGASEDSVPMPFGYYSASTDADGHYDLGQIPAGYYSIFVSSCGYLGIGQETELTADNAAMDFTMEAVPVGSVTGTVTDDTGNPIPDALVNATQPYVDPFTFTDADGHFELTNVPAGNWRVGAYKEGYSARAVTVEISEDVVINLDFTLPSDSTPPPTDLVTLTGRVLDGSTNEAIADADIVAVATDDSYHSYVKSDADGNYTLQLPAGTYNVLVESADYQDVYIQVWVDPESPSYDFYMWPKNFSGGGPGGWGTIVNGQVPPPTAPPSEPPPDGNGPPPEGR